VCVGVQLAKRDSAVAVLHKIVQAQGEIHPGWHSDYLEAWLVQRLVERAIELLK